MKEQGGREKGRGEIEVGRGKQCVEVKQLHSRDEVVMFANGLDQFHQEGLVVDITRTKTLLIL